MIRPLEDTVGIYPNGVSSSIMEVESMLMLIISCTGQARPCDSG